MKKLILFLFLLSPIHRTKSSFAGSFFLSLLLLTGNSISTVRYVSHSGTDTPPYLTWETAADSIMSAINISSFGDTIYVANGVYEEQVVMIPGLSLIGAGMDSCVIDMIALSPTQPHAVKMKDSCLAAGFKLLFDSTVNHAEQVFICLIPRKGAVFINNNIIYARSRNLGNRWIN